MASCTCVPASFRAFVVTCPTRCRLLVSSFRKSLPAVFSSSVSPTEQKSEVLGESRSPSTRVREPCRTWTVSSLSSASQFLRGPSPVQEVRRGFGTGAYWALNKERLYDETKLDEWREGFPNLHKYNNEALQTWRRVFDSFDSDRDGFITQADLQKTPEFTVAKAQKLKDYDADQNNMIDFGEFVEAMYNVDKEMFLESFEGFDPVDVQLEFDKYAVVDEASPTKKQIPQNRVKQMMLDYRFTCVTENDAQRLFDEMDVNKDGVIDLADFKQCVQSRSS